MKYLIPVLFLALVACGEKKQHTSIQENKEALATDEVKKQPQEFKKEEAVTHIRELFAKINEQSKTAEIIEKEMMEESAEGGQLKAYKYNGKVIKLVVLAFGETGRTSKEYYFEDERLIFVFTKEEYYDRPMYVEGAKISKTVENRYYFYNEQLFKWLDPQKNEVNIDSAPNISENILLETKDYLDQI